MVKNNKTNKNIFHISIIIIFSILFITLLLFARSSSSTKTNYTFNKNITINNIDELNLINIGNVVVQNDGFLPKRIELDKYIICDFSNKGKQYSIVNYRGKSKTVSGKLELFEYDYYQKRIDVASNEKINLIMTINHYLYNIKNLQTKESKNNELNLYLYKKEDNQEYYDFCKYSKKEDAFKMIKLNLNITNQTNEQNNNNMVIDKNEE